MAKNPAPKKASSFYTGVETVQTEYEHTDTHVDDREYVSADTHVDVHECVSDDTHEHTHKHTHKPKQKKRERRSRRMNLLVKPSTADGILAIADREDRSANDIINELMENYIKEHK